ncbi:MAG TPA: sensor histidine kinase [Terriglobales bacterium]|nr:sensor histidine kinase [Terriglobales bacterium]
MSHKAATRRQIADTTASDAAEVSRHLLKGEEAERRRISRELHDETGQALMVLRFQLEMLASDAKSPGQKAKVQESLEVLDRTIEGLRRIIARLSPRVLEEFGLIAAIRRHAQLLASQTRMKARVELPEEIAAMDHDIEVAVYRSAQEALHNIAKHSRAQNFTVRLYIAGGRIHLEIEDDGTGVSTKVPDDGGFGLTGMRERAVALGGSMTMQSRRGRGTQIRIVLPFNARESFTPETIRSARAVRRSTTAKAS